MTAAKPGDESLLGDGEVKAYMNRAGYSVMTTKEFQIQSKLGKDGQLKRDDHPIKLVIQGSVTDYHTRAREWRKYGDNMHERAMEAERLLTLYRAKFGSLQDPDMEPIPTEVYFSRESNNFYNNRGHGMGAAFYTKWYERKDDFPRNVTELIENWSNAEPEKTDGQQSD